MLTTRVWLVSWQLSRSFAALRLLRLLRLSRVFKFERFESKLIINLDLRAAGQVSGVVSCRTVAVVLTFNTSQVRLRLIKLGMSCRVMWWHQH